MDITATFLPVAVDLIDNVFPTAITYRQQLGNDYDPATGQVQTTWRLHQIKAGVLNRKRTETGGTEETYELTLWVHHGATGLAVLPTTADEVIYDGITWQVTKIDPTYSSAGLIASKITARAPS